jgi:Protein of unknown function (DUF3072)
MRVHYPNELLIGVAPKYQRGESVSVRGEAERVAMTLAQASYLMMLCEETHQVLDDSLTEAEAAGRIAELEEATGRSRGHGSPLRV